MSVASVYVIFANAEEAERVGRQMVDERLAACVNILAPCRSIYRWDGDVQMDEEVPVIFKTSNALLDTLIARVAALHSYDVPCIVSWPVEKLLADYADWVESSVSL